MQMMFFLDSFQENVNFFGELAAAQWLSGTIRY